MPGRHPAQDRADSPLRPRGQRVAQGIDVQPWPTHSGARDEAMASRASRRGRSPSLKSALPGRAQTAQKRFVLQSEVRGAQQQWSNGCGWALSRGGGDPDSDPDQDTDQDMDQAQHTALLLRSHWWWLLEHHGHTVATHTVPFPSASPCPQLQPHPRSRGYPVSSHRCCPRALRDVVSALC